MVAGFFLGTTVASLTRKSAKIDRLVDELVTGKEQAIADRMAAIKAAQADIAEIEKL